MLVDPHRSRAHAAVPRPRTGGPAAAGIGADARPAAGPAAPRRPAAARARKTRRRARPDAPAGDLWEHVLLVLDHLGPAPSFPLAFAALLHDVGKPRTVGRTPERYTFHGHEHVGRRMASEICLRLKLSNDERERVEWLVEKHQILADARQMRTSKLKTLWSIPASASCSTCTAPTPSRRGKDTAHVDYCEQLLKEWTVNDLNPDADPDRARPDADGSGAGAAVQAPARRACARPNSTARSRRGRRRWRWSSGS